MASVEATSVMLEVGLISRPHGLKGDVMVSMISNRLERVASGSMLTVKTGSAGSGSGRLLSGSVKSGSAMSLKVVSARAHGNAHGHGAERIGGVDGIRKNRVADTNRKMVNKKVLNKYVVNFAGIDSREQAEALRGSVLYAPPLDDPDELWVHQLVGAKVVDQAGISRGEVVSVVANPACDLLELVDGTLVPSRFVVAVDNTASHASDTAKRTAKRNAGSRSHAQDNAGSHAQLHVETVYVDTPDGLFV